MSDVNIQISKDIIAPILEKKIQVAILEALGDKDVIINQMVSSILNDKVGSDGKKSSYSSDNKYDFVQIAFRDAIRKAAQETVVTYIGECVPQIKAEFLRQLKTKKGSAGFVDALLNSLTKAATNSYRFETKVDIIPPRD